MYTKTKFWKITGTAWRIVTQHPSLWIWGLLASFIAFDGLYAALMAQGAQLGSQQAIFSVLLAQYGSANAYQSPLTVLIDKFSGPLPSFISAVLTLVIILAFLLLCALAEVIVITRTAAAVHSSFPQKSRIVSAGPSALPVLTITVVARLLEYGVLLVLNIPVIYILFTLGPSALTVAHFIGLLATFVVALCIEFVSTFAINALLIDRLSVSAALQRGWDVFGRAPLLAIKIAVWLFVMRIASMVTVLLTSLTVGLPFLAIWMVTGTGAGAVGNSILMIAGAVAYLAFILLIQAVYGTVMVGTWTVAYVMLSPDSKFISALHAAASAGRTASAAAKHLKDTYTKNEPVIKKAATGLAALASRGLRAAKKTLAKKPTGKKTRHSSAK